MSALADQLIKNNLAMPKADSPLYMAALEFFKKGCGRARAHEIIDRAYERLNPNDDAEATPYVRASANALVPLASSPQASERDQSSDAQPRQAHAVPPARPTIDLYGAASLAAGNMLAQSVFDRVKTSDGRPWGDVGAHELDGMAHDGKMAMAIKNRLGVLTNAQRFMKIRDILRPETFEEIKDETNGS